MCISKLIPKLQERLDNGDIGMRVAEAVSFLRLQEQEVLEKMFARGKKISIKQADMLKEKSKNGELTEDFINEILSTSNSDSEVKAIKLSGHFLEKHFKSEQSSEKIEKIINAALEMYFSREDIIE